MALDHLDSVEQIALATLVHHIEDLHDRAGGYGISLGLQGLIESCRPWEELVQQASFLAAGPSKEDVCEGGVPAHFPLVSVFSGVSLLGAPEGKEKKIGCFFPPRPLSEKPIFPVRLGENDLLEWKDHLLTTEHYQGLWRDLSSDFEQILQSGVHLNKCMLLMQKYTSFIPHEIVTFPEGLEGVENFLLPDVSLFDHLRMAVAIGTCLYRYTSYHSRELFPRGNRPEIKGEYLLVAGDFSGVQDFVYTISSRGALKTLRARSFFLELLGLHVVEQIIERARLSWDTNKSASNRVLSRGSLAQKAPFR